MIQRHQISFREINAEDVHKVTGKLHAICIKETFTDLSEQEIQLLISETMEEGNLILFAILFFI